MRAAFEHPVEVRWRDTDALGHVNHAVFLTYLEEGRDAFYARALGADPIYVVVRLEVDLRTEVRHQDRRLIVRIEVERLGTTSLATRETILTPAGEVAAEARVVTVRWDPVSRTPVPFSAAERARLAAAEVEEAVMELTLLTVPACPNAAAFEERLTAALGGRADVVLRRREVADEHEAAQAGMHGSPTLLINGIDPFAEPGQPPSLSCRLYRDTDGRPAPAPSVEILRQAIAAAAG
jgi:YbgC/YbaW family acyl-CoA thioester hydrolase